jgi:hypothetical protein
VSVSFPGDFSFAFAKEKMSRSFHGFTQKELFYIEKFTKWTNIIIFPLLFLCATLQRQSPSVFLTATRNAAVHVNLCLGLLHARFISLGHFPISHAILSRTLGISAKKLYVPINKKIIIFFSFRVW